MSPLCSKISLVPSPSLIVCREACGDRAKAMATARARAKKEEKRKSWYPLFTHMMKQRSE